MTWKIRCIWLIWLWPWKTEKQKHLNDKSDDLFGISFRLRIKRSQEGLLIMIGSWNFDCLVDHDSEWERAWLTYFFDPPWEIKEVEQLLVRLLPTKHETHSSLQKLHIFALRIQCVKNWGNWKGDDIFFGKMTCGFWRVFLFRIQITIMCEKLGKLKGHWYFSGKLVVFDEYLR